jgi:hypothetical protein
LHTQPGIPLLANSSGETFENVGVSPEGDKECIIGYATPDTALEIRTGGLLVNGEACFCTDDVFAKVIPNKKTKAKMCLGRLRAQAKFVPKAIERLLTEKPDLLERVGSSTDMDVDPPNVTTATVHTEAVEDSSIDTAISDAMDNDPPNVPVVTAVAQVCEDTTKPMATALVDELVDCLGDDMDIPLKQLEDVDMDAPLKKAQMENISGAVQMLMGVDQKLPLSSGTKKLTVKIMREILNGSLKGILKQSISKLKKKSDIYGVLYNTLEDALRGISPEERVCLTKELGDDIFKGKIIAMDLVLEKPSAKK